MRIEPDSITFLDAVVFRILPSRSLSKLKNTATPSVANCEFWLCSGAVVTISNFLQGTSCQRIYILGDGSTTIANNTTIKTNTGANKLLAANKVYRYTLFNNVWCEDE